MPKFQVEIEEKLQKVEEVEAENIEDALEIVEEKYNNEEIVLSYEDFVTHETREYVPNTRREDFVKDTIFNISYGQAILLEGNEDVALIKKIRVKDFPYVVATGIKVNKYETGFEWNQGSYHQNLNEAIEKFEELSEYNQKQNNLVYSELGKITLENNNIEKFENIDKIFEFLIDVDIDKEQLIEMLSDRIKEEIIMGFADSVVEENGEYYYGEYICFFEDEINEKTKKIDEILERLNIKDIKPYDVIELLEQDDSDKIEERLVGKIYNSIKAAGYNKTIDDFIEYINEELYNENNEREENEDEDEL